MMVKYYNIFPMDDNKRKADLKSTFRFQYSILIFIIHKF